MVKRKKAKTSAKRAKIKKVRAVRKSKAARPRPRAKAVKKAISAPGLTLEKIGGVTHYFPHVKAAAVLILKDSLKVGDDIYIKGHTTDFKEKVASIQLDRVPIEEGKKGQEIGLLVKKRVRIGDSVYKV